MSIKPSHILGHNARYRYTALNDAAAKKYGFSKLKTKELMRSFGIPTAEVYHVFENREDLDQVNWENLPVPFVVKPASGSAGKGIVVIKKKLQNQSIWVSSQGEHWRQEDLELHVSNILDGEFSTWGSNHKALIEEMIPPHPKLAKYAYRGTPDIRVVVFNSVPIMAMARIPTAESQGKANLDQGAIGLGIDMGSGITTHGVKGKGKLISHFPNKTKRKVNGILIPHWKKCLEVAVQAADAAGYRFMGADLFIHPEKGPMIVELNGFPGLSIQLANQAGMKRRLERVEGLDVLNPQHGVKIGQALFAEIFVDEIKAEEGLTILPYKPNIQVFDDKNQTHSVEAMINTGRYRSAISQKLAEELGHFDLDDMLWREKELVEGQAPVVEVTIKIKDRTITTAMVVVKKLNKKTNPIELGIRDIQGFLVGEVE